ncbi:MAG: hypothetical protein QUS14_00135 [Pyrinomonadaceae bacterium]|nr:hypothetical protein [Pyrinomonadaceae bacterium]
MKRSNLFLFAILVALSAAPLFAQQTLLKRTIYKNDRFDFGVGGTLSVVGAPNGSIRVEGWRNREIEISAEIQVQAPTEEGLTRLSDVTGFVLEESLGRTAIISLGTHDKKYLRAKDKKFPKELVAMPTRIDYVIKVPMYTDLQINGGVGDLLIDGIEGTMSVNFVTANGSINLVGGGLSATFGTGSVTVSIAKPNWRGRFADVQMASGELNVSLPAGINAEFDATVLRTGRIENELTGFKPRVRNAQFTDRAIAAKAGVGVTPLKFTIGDGTLKIVEANRPS